VLHLLCQKAEDSLEHYVFIALNKFDLRELMEN